ncbi:MAG TPA: L,D-transpeptidase [Burkholderiales bacterium]|nr:L,D-transpeptidase [Burkholderiales bacterium]
MPIALAVALLLFAHVLHAAPLAADFAREVDRRLALPPEEQAYYGALLGKALTPSEAHDDVLQFYVLVDRNPLVQALLVYWRAGDGGFQFVGAAPVSTGRPGSYEHFITPAGVFAHSLANPDFRAEGTPNKLGIRGYGEKGLRVYDFGWQRAERGWGRGGWSKMRLQMHATDPRLLEPRLGTPASEGCIRIPATLNAFIDRHGLLDADYEEAARRGEHLWILRPDRLPSSFAGRWLVVIDSGRTARPTWARRG